jgi:hypothetical protein
MKKQKEPLRIGKPIKLHGLSTKEILMSSVLKDAIKPKLATFCAKCNAEMELEIVESNKPEFRLMYKGYCKNCGWEMKQPVCNQST